MVLVLLLLLLLFIRLEFNSTVKVNNSYFTFLYFLNIFILHTLISRLFILAIRIWKERHVGIVEHIYNIQIPIWKCLFIRQDNIVHNTQLPGPSGHNVYNYHIRCIELILNFLFILWKLKNGYIWPNKSSLIRNGGGFICGCQRDRRCVLRLQHHKNCYCYTISKD